jgi:hypothetical protein
MSTSTPDSNDGPLPAMFEHCCNVYDQMHKEAKYEKLDPILVQRVPDVGGAAVRVYRGQLTKLVAALNLSSPYYTSVKNGLVGMGCVIQLQRGGGTTPSAWLMIRRPTEDLWKSKFPVSDRRKSNTRTDRIEQSQRDIAGRITDLEGFVNTLMVAQGLPAPYRS